MGGRKPVLSRLLRKGLRYVLTDLPSLRWVDVDLVCVEDAGVITKILTHSNANAIGTEVEGGRHARAPPRWGLFQQRV